MGILPWFSVTGPIQVQEFILRRTLPLVQSLFRLLIFSNIQVIFPLRLLFPSCIVPQYNKAVYTAKDAVSLILLVVLVKNGTFAWLQLVCDQRMDKPMYVRTDGRTYPLIEMRERI